MDDDIDHYSILGLPSGEKGSKLSQKEISTAYRLKAKVSHPDKRPNDPNAPSNFQKLHTSYEILKDEKARKLFDDLLQVKKQKRERQLQQDSKRRRMMSDLEEREKNAFYNHYPTSKTRDEEEIIVRKLREEINRIREMHGKNKTSFTETGESSRRNERVVDTDKEKMLKVSWGKGGLVYSEERLRGVFETFGEVEDVVIRSSKKKGSALVVMASKEAAVAACESVYGDVSNPLLVIPLQPAVNEEEFVGEAFEDSVLQKLQKAAERQKRVFL